MNTSKCWPNTIHHIKRTFTKSEIIKTAHMMIATMLFPPAIETKLNHFSTNDYLQSGSVLYSVFIWRYLTELMLAFVYTYKSALFLQTHYLRWTYFSHNCVFMFLVPLSYSTYMVNIIRRTYLKQSQAAKVHKLPWKGCLWISKQALTIKKIYPVIIWLKQYFEWYADISHECLFCIDKLCQQCIYICKTPYNLPCIT